MTVSPTQLLPLLSGLAGKGGGSTKVSQSVSQNSSALVNLSFVGGSGTPSTGAINLPQSTSTASGDRDAAELPTYSDGGFGIGSTGATGGDMIMGEQTGFFTKQTAIYGFGALAIAGAAFYFMKGRK